MKFLILLFISVCPSFAAVTLVGQFGNLYEADAVTQLQVDAVGVIVADASGDGISDPFGATLTTGHVFGGDNIILDVLQVVDFGGGFGYGLNIGACTYSYSGDFAAGDRLWIMWFPTILSPDSVVGASVGFGQYRSDTINLASASEIAFFAPPDGGLYALAALTDNLVPDSGVTASEFAANMVTAPEPASWCLIALAATGCVVFHRRTIMRLVKCAS